MDFTSDNSDSQEKYGRSLAWAESKLVEELSEHSFLMSDELFYQLQLPQTHRTPDLSSTLELLIYFFLLPIVYLSSFF